MTDALTGHRTLHGRVRRPSGEPPPLPRELNRAAIAWLCLLAAWSAIWAWIFLSDAPAVWITERDLEWMGPIIDNRARRLTTIMQRTNDIALPWLTIVVGWCTIVGGLFAKRVRHVLLFIAALSSSAVIATSVANRIERPRPLGFELLGEWEGFAQPSRPVTLLAATFVSCGLTMVPAGAPRRWWIAATATVIVFVGFAQVYLAVDHPTDVFAGATVGVAVALLLFRTGAPEKVFPIAYRTGRTAHLDVTGARGDAIRLALGRQIGVELTGMEPVGLAGSAGSTPLRIEQQDGPDLFAKLYAKSHLRSDRSYKLFRTLVYGRLEDEQPFSSVRRLIQHEDYMLRVMSAAGVDTMNSVGIVEITPDREYLLVSEFLEGAVEISEAEVTVDLIDQGLATVAAMWHAGLAHRDIKPANIMIQGDRLKLIDVAFGQIRPSPWRQAVDLANMMLVLALSSDAKLVYERALRSFTEQEIAEAFSASRGVTLPSALRAEVRRDGRQLDEQFCDLAPDCRSISIQRLSLRRVALTFSISMITAILALAFVTNLHNIGLWP